MCDSAQINYRSTFIDCVYQVEKSTLGNRRLFGLGKRPLLNLSICISVMLEFLQTSNEFPNAGMLGAEEAL